MSRGCVGGDSQLGEFLRRQLGRGGETLWSGHLWPLALNLCRAVRAALSQASQVDLPAHGTADHGLVPGLASLDLRHDEFDVSFAYSDR